MRIAILLAVLLCTTVLAGDTELRVIEPRHAQAEELLPLVREQLSGDETVSLYRNTLIVNARPDALARIDELLDKLDTPRRNLLISLRRQRDAVTQSSGSGASGSVSYGETHDGRHGLSATTVVRSSRRISTSDASGGQSIRALEGASVLLRDGQMVALPERYYWDGGMAYGEVERGFIVSARLQGDGGVILDIDARDDHLQHGTIRTGALSSSISGRLGEWIHLGGSSDSTIAGSRGAGTRHETQDGESARYEIMVELVD